jgi:para-nitrobenzyl esterase
MTSTRVRAGIAVAIHRTLPGLLLALAAAASISITVAQSDPIVAVTGGQIRGRAQQSGAVFKGIPFAAPPVGDLRWKPPAPVLPWQGVRDAGEYGATCAQIDANWNTLAASKGKEDCLFLNVWAPEWPPKRRHAVMMWIHGGGNQGGSALGLGGIEPSFDGEAMSKRGVVFVTVQYRLGILGFLAHPELTAESPHHSSGNYATQDQIAALKWIRENIARFGGDPANVTVFGQSAGGNNTGQLLVSPLSAGLFARAIEESGTVVGSGRITPRLARAEAAGIAFAQKMGAPATGALAYMRKLPVEAVLKAEPTYGTGGIGPNADGYVIKDVSAKTFAAGEEKQVPLLIGSTARERSLEGGPEAVMKAVTEFYDDLAPKAMGFYTTTASTYPPYGDGGAQFATDTMNRCPSIAIEEFHASAGNVVWAYEFSHAFPEAKRGASHSGELRYVFGNFPPGDVADSEKRISHDIQTYWTNYAKTGDPNGGGLPPWPRFDVKTRRYLEFTDNGPVAKENLRGEACAFFIDFLKQKIARQ